MGWLTEDACQIGVADGAFAAEQAARRGVIVPPGESPEFLADFPVTTLSPFGHVELVDLLQRLGIHTLGAFAALPARDVLARFGPAGAWAHRQAGGRDDRPVVVREPPAEFTVTVELEPPVDRVDIVAFSARERRRAVRRRPRRARAGLHLLRAGGLHRQRRGADPPLAASPAC